ncbi:unnamed protein product [Mytilus edulis]|uniref:Uncharacterized protein n=1 Tax=Mytilus edulis TaxID=6550 RepID=A0A8S3SPC3_MYTED|nr:unnamed protein product [Mytilus edulis]
MGTNSSSYGQIIQSSSWEKCRKGWHSKDHLLISLEPEAASIYCQYLPTEKLSGAESGFTMWHSRHNCTRKISWRWFKELSRATGGDCGGTSVDADFIQLLAKIFGAPLIHTMKQEEPEAYLDLLREFETVKGQSHHPKKEDKYDNTLCHS